MTPLSALALVLGGLVVGYIVARVEASLLSREATLAAETTAARSETQAAYDRLYAAWREGYVVPTTTEEIPPTHVVEPLPSPLREWVEQWDEVGRAYYLPHARSLLAGGLAPEFVVMELDRRRGIDPESVA